MISPCDIKLSCSIPPGPWAHEVPYLSLLDHTLLCAGEEQKETKQRSLMQPQGQKPSYPAAAAGPVVTPAPLLTPSRQPEKIKNQLAHIFQRSCYRSAALQF